MQQEQHQFVDSFLHKFAERRSMFDEDELKRRLEVVYEEISNLIDHGRELQTKTLELKRNASHYEPVYVKLTTDDPLVFFSGQTYERRPRVAGRPNSKEANSDIIRDQLNELKNTQCTLEFLTIDPFLNPYIEKEEQGPYVTETT
ncbi:unnamed protein product [Cylicostephanus goldi]|uniref:Uncharacterized protein n=1 Tax=Cylicostephanus goldi TaxID=71465 RepID=A0A3P7MQI9_CYLGO|nr:unnamed protein product [Cylicostephanus goldi]